MKIVVKRIVDPNALRVTRIRKKNFRLVLHEVFPSPKDNPSLRVCKLECGHPQVTLTPGKFVRCFRCTKSKNDENLWVTLNEIVSKPLVLPKEEPPPTEEKETSSPPPPEEPKGIKATPGTRIVIRKIKNSLVPCGVCGGVLRTSPCSSCKGHGTVPRFDRGNPVIRKPTKMNIWKRLSLEDLSRFGFEKTGKPTEEMSEEKLVFLVRKWYQTSDLREKSKLEGEIATAGYFRPPPTMQEMLIKYPPPPPPEPKVKEPPKAKIVIRLKKEPT